MPNKKKNLLDICMIGITKLFDLIHLLRTVRNWRVNMRHLTRAYTHTTYTRERALRMSG